MPVAVRHIMTHNLTIFPNNASVVAARKEMEQEQFDVAPITVDGHITKYAVLSDLKESKATNEIIREGKSLNEKHFVGKEVPVLVLDPNGRDLLSILNEREQHFSFVIEDGIEGIVTFADLNKSIAGTAFYYLIATFEDYIAGKVDDAVEHDSWMEHFSDEQQQEIRGRYSQAERENADLRLVNCLSTGQMRELIIEYDVWDSIGFESEDDADALLSKVVAIRHSVMHPRPVVGKNSIGEINQTFQQIKSLLPLK